MDFLDDIRIQAEKNRSMILAAGYTPLPVDPANWDKPTWAAPDGREISTSQALKEIKAGVAAAAAETARRAAAEAETAAEAEEHDIHAISSEDPRMKEIVEFSNSLIRRIRAAGYTPVMDGVTYHLSAAENYLPDIVPQRGSGWRPAIQVKAGLSEAQSAIASALAKGDLQEALRQATEDEKPRVYYSHGKSHVYEWAAWAVSALLAIAAGEAIDEPYEAQKRLEELAAERGDATIGDDIRRMWQVAKALADQM